MQLLPSFADCAIIGAMKVTNICSGSRGNCTLVVGDNTTMLVDIGLTCKRLELAFAGLGVATDKVDAILITHEHTDHISGLEVFVKKYPHVRIYVHPLVWDRLQVKFAFFRTYHNVHKFEYLTKFSVGEFSVVALENMHDSITCASFIIHAGGGKLGIATDLGVITDRQVDMLSMCKVVFLECNHDKSMLNNCGYGYMQRQRIASANGHLSNEQCAKAAIRLVSKQTRVVVLSHISGQSNLPELAYGHVSNAFAEAGVEGTILLAWQDKPTKTITIH